MDIKNIIKCIIQYSILIIQIHLNNLIFKLFWKVFFSLFFNRKAHINKNILIGISYPLINSVGTKGGNPAPYPLSSHKLISPISTINVSELVILNIVNIIIKRYIIFIEDLFSSIKKPP